MCLAFVIHQRFVFVRVENRCVNKPKYLLFVLQILHSRRSTRVFFALKLKRIYKATRHVLLQNRTSQFAITGIIIYISHCSSLPIAIFSCRLYICDVHIYLYQYVSYNLDASSFMLWYPKGLEGSWRYTFHQWHLVQCRYTKIRIIVTNSNGISNNKWVAHTQVIVWLLDFLLLHVWNWRYIHKIQKSV